ncbi:MAG: hypothetical protein AB7I50_25885 [Vicinamibacterales bacterium]
MGSEVPDAVGAELMLQLEAAGIRGLDDTDLAFLRNLQKRARTPLPVPNGFVETIPPLIGTLGSAQTCEQ